MVGSHDFPGRAERLRVLASAMTADGYDVGEAWSAFHWLNGLSEIADITLVTVANRRGVRDVQFQLPRVRVIELSPFQIFEQFSRFQAMVKPSFLKIHHVARRMARAHRANFDLFHSITPNALRFPSPFVGLGVPFIHGPCGGCLAAPARLQSSFEVEPWYVRLRVIDQFRLKYDPFLLRTFCESACPIGIGRYVERIVPAWPSDRAAYMNDTGVEKIFGEGLVRPELTIPTVLFVGRLIPKKGVHLMLHALAALNMRGTWRCRIVGDGHFRTELESLAVSLQIRDSIEFLGQVSKDKVFDEYRAADIFCFPSLNETSGNALLEAMSFGLPCLVADNGGPGEVVSESFGIKVPLGEEDQFIANLASALRRYLSSYQERQSAGQMAMEEIRRKHLWSVKISKMSAIYRRVVDENRNNPKDAKASASIPDRRAVTAE